MASAGREHNCRERGRELDFAIDGFFGDHCDDESARSDGSFGSIGTPSEIDVPKDVVLPGVYTLDSNLCFRKFLSDFERYFSIKFYGNDRDKCREFVKFLDGEIKQVFLNVGGDHLGYSSVKENLLVWYDSQKILRDHKKKQVFYQARLKEGESYTLYCLRLRVLADLAFSNSTSKKYRKLKEQIKATMPVNFLESYEHRKELKNMLGMGKISWSDILEIAATQDEKLIRDNIQRGRGFSDCKMDKPRGITSVFAEKLDLSSDTQTGCRNSKIPLNYPVLLEKKVILADEFNRSSIKSSHYKIYRKSLRGRCFRCKLVGHYIANCTVKVIKCSSCGHWHHKNISCQIFNENADETFAGFPTCESIHSQGDLSNSSVPGIFGDIRDSPQKNLDYLASGSNSKLSVVCKKLSNSMDYLPSGNDSIGKRNIFRNTSLTDSGFSISDENSVRD